MSDTWLTNIDVGKLSEPLTKLVVSVSAAVAGYAKPYQIRRVAEADADALIIRTESEIESAELRYRAVERIGYREIRRQQNIESIIQRAADQLPDAVSEQPVDEDWIFRFFDISQDVSNQEMQELWARILAGEVTEPGSFSPRTLHILRLLQPDDALLFSRLCNYVSDRCIILLHRNMDKYFNERGLPLESIMHLSSQGLARIDSDLSIIVQEDVEGYHMSYGDKIIYFEKRSKDQQRKLHTYILTDVGEEIYTLTDPEPDYDYLDQLIEYYSGGFEIHVTQVNNEST